MIHMLTYPNINPVALKIGALKIYWYGIMYVIGFISAWVLARYRASKPTSSFTKEQVGDLIFYAALGVILGGRLGYFIFYYLVYNFSFFLADPWVVFRIWEGGMSFHGALLGVVISLWLFARKNERQFLSVADFLVPFIPLGLFLGRLGNFINGELWGRVTSVPWAMIFPQVDLLPRHPSQLYEAFFEGLVLFVFLWWYSSSKRVRGSVSAWFLIGYGAARFLCEFWRQPDSFAGFVAFDWLTMGQLLSLPMMVVGFVMLIVIKHNYQHRI